MGKNKPKIKGKFCCNCKYYDDKESSCGFLTSLNRFKDKIYVNSRNICSHFTYKGSKIYYHGS